MFPKSISLITLGVADLARSRAFYEALGWQQSSAVLMTRDVERPAPAELSTRKRR